MRVKGCFECTKNGAYFERLSRSEVRCQALDKERLKPSKGWISLGRHARYKVLVDLGIAEIELCKERLEHLNGVEELLLVISIENRSNRPEDLMILEEIFRCGRLNDDDEGVHDVDSKSYAVDRSLGLVFVQNT